MHRKAAAGATASIRDGSFFSGVKLHLEDVVKITFYCVGLNLSVKQCAQLMDFNYHSGTYKTVIHYYRMIRHVMRAYLVANPIQIGGPGRTVEIGRVSNSNNNLFYNKQKLQSLRIVKLVTT